MPVRRHLATAR